MKKIIQIMATIAMLICLCFGLAACGDTKEKSTEETGAEEQIAEGAVYAVVNGEAWVLGYDGLNPRVQIAETYKNAPVTTIVDSAFANSTITSVVIPDSVTSIGNSAFHNCKSLLYVAIGDGVTTIGSSAFYGCVSLKVVEMSNCATSIGNGAFYGCTTLTVVKMSDCATNIDERAFYNCSSLTSIMIPDSVTSIGEQAFYNCSSLTSVYITDIVAWCQILFGDANANPFCYAKNLYLNNELVTELIIPDSVTSIGNYAFNACSGLMSVVIGNSVTSIGDYAFYKCSSLTSVVIGNSVTSVGAYAFYDCDSLTSINYRGTKSQWSAISYSWSSFTGSYTITYEYTGK